MSLFSILNATWSGSGQSASVAGALGSSVDATIAQVQAAAAKSATTSTSGSTSGTGSGVQITAAARLAAAEKADSAKTAAALAKDVRTTFDAQYKAGKPKGAPDVTQLSGRALATVILNSDGGFSKAEVHAAKAEMKARDRSSALAMLSGGLTADGLSDYSSGLLGKLKSMSSEERSLRGKDGLFKG